VFRESIAEQYGRDYGMTVDPETEVCVTCGSTEAMIASMLGVLDPGEEVVIFEPYYEEGLPVGPRGFEPRTCGLRVRCSARLS
jgi:aspartate/methionine/tyrosine aminotransferase